MHDQTRAPVRVTIALAICIATLGTVFGGADSATAGSVRSASGICTPYAVTPHVYPWKAAYGDGIVNCIMDVGFDYSLSLRNNAGDTLASKSGTVYSVGGGWEGTTATVGCAGAIVHSFLYINQAGNGASDTSGTNSDCAY